MAKKSKLTDDTKRNVMENHQTETYQKIHFAVMAIEASAKKAHLSGKEMYDRLKRQDLIHKRLFRHYEQLHTQSLDWVTDDIIETLHNWELEEKESGVLKSEEDES